MMVVGSSSFGVRVVLKDVRQIENRQEREEGTGGGADGEEGEGGDGAGGDELRAGVEELVRGGEGESVHHDGATGAAAAADGAADGGDGAPEGGAIDASGDLGDGTAAAATAADDAISSPRASASVGSSLVPDPTVETDSPARHRLLHPALAAAPGAATPLVSRPARLAAQPPGVDRQPVDEETLLGVYLRELRAAVDLTARMASVQAVQTACVHGAQVLVTVEAYDPIATWTQYKDGMLLALCSCAGVLGLGRASLRGLPMEFAQMEAALGRRCTCRHALALLRAYDEIGHDVSALNHDDLFRACPALLGPLADNADDAPVGTITYLVLHSGKRRNIPVYAVYYNDAWAPVVVRPTANKFRLATCCQMPCQTRPWGCIHAKAVNKVTRADASSAAACAEMEREEALQFGPDGLLNETEPAPEPPPRAARMPALPMPVVAPAPQHKRRARNMFPCASEVAMCDSYSAALDTLRDNNKVRELLPVHAEESCLDCGEERNGKMLTACSALLYTMRGRLQINIGVWTCSKGHVVHYDGAEDGLFAASPETVYVRVFFVAVLGICVIGRSTMAAAAEYLTSLLRNTGAYAEGEFGQARQLLSDACGDFSETLVIPDAAFKCTNCGEAEEHGGRFECVLMDGQVLAVLQEHILPMVRPGMDAPRVALAITYACAVRNATVRAVMRHRVRSGADDPVALTTEEARKYRAFAMEPFAERPAPPPPPSETSRGLRSLPESEHALRWAAHKLFSTFFTVPNIGAVGSLPTGAAAVAGRAGAAAEEHSGGSDDDSLVDLVSVAGSTDGSSSEYSSDEINMARGEDSSADSVVGDDNNDASHLTVSAATFASSAVGAVADGGERGSAGAPDETGLDEELQGLGLDERPPTTSFSPAASAPSTPPPASDGTEFLLEAPAGEVDEDLPDSVESVRARVPKTKCMWKVPLLSVVPPSDPPAEEDDPVAVNPADPNSLLTQRAMKAVNEIFKKKRTGELLPIVKHGAIPLYSANFHNLLPGKWLDDEGINAYSLLLEWRHKKTLLLIPTAPKLYFFSTFLYKQLWFMHEYSYDIVRRWTKNVDIFSMDKIFIPINWGDSHWILVVVRVGAKTGTVSMYDSLGGQMSLVTSSITQWLIDEANDKGKPQREWTHHYPKCRQQENSDDCGVFTLSTMDLLARGLPLSFNTRSTAYYRCRIAAELLSGCVGGTG